MMRRLPVVRLGAGALAGTVTGLLLWHVPVWVCAVALAGAAGLLLVVAADTMRALRRPAPRHRRRPGRMGR
jgi:hypothetical protein